MPTLAEGEVVPADVELATLLPGTLLYSTRSVPDDEALVEGVHGCVYMLLSEYNGTQAPECAEFLRYKVAPGPVGREFHCDLGKKGRLGSSLDVNKGAPYRPFASQL